MRKAVIPFLAAITLVAAMLWQGMTVEPVLTEAPSARLVKLSGYTDEELAPGETELKVLPADTGIYKRLYTSSDGSSFFVSMIVGGRSKGSVHRPEMCLPAHGLEMRTPQTIEAGGRPWRQITLAKGPAKSLFAYTFFNQAGFVTCSHTSRIFRDILDRSFLGRIDRWVMVTVNSPVRDEERFELFLNDLVKGAIDEH